MLDVLLIDDDEKLGPLLAEYCARYDIKITHAVKPSAGFELLASKTFNAVILDVMLPEMDGFEVCKKIRTSSEIPIVMLTARGEVMDRVVGLEIGADDYLPKPFEPRELVARINNIVQRKKSVTASADRLEFDGVVIDLTQREVFVRDSLVTLTTMEYQLLVLMAKAPGKDFTRDDILNGLKGTETELFTRSVDILVSRLRSKLKPEQPIKTVYGSGYAFVAKPMDSTG